MQSNQHNLNSTYAESPDYSGYQGYQNVPGDNYVPNAPPLDVATNNRRGSMSSFERARLQLIIGLLSIIALGAGFLWYTTSVNSAFKDQLRTEMDHFTHDVNTNNVTLAILNSAMNDLLTTTKQQGEVIGNLSSMVKIQGDAVNKLLTTSVDQGDVINNLVTKTKSQGNSIDQLVAATQSQSQLIDKLNYNVAANYKLIQGLMSGASTPTTSMPSVHFMLVMLACYLAVFFFIDFTAFIFRLSAKVGF